jgi:formylglycine-generating enzyme required for sulfatase activity
MTMLLIPAGGFWRDDPRPGWTGKHRVSLSSFYICDREVWQDLFQEFLKDPTYPQHLKPEVQVTPQPGISSDGLVSARNVTWFDAVLFCNWLSSTEGRVPCYTVAGSRNPKTRMREWTVSACRFESNGYRLPTEAEWEYACRAKTATEFSFGNEAEGLLEHYGWFLMNAQNRVHPGGQKLPNGWGLFDMHGNVAEWCWDWYAPGFTDPLALAGAVGWLGSAVRHRPLLVASVVVADRPGNRKDPQGPATGAERVLRGGDCYTNSPDEGGSGFHHWKCAPGERSSTYGFRVVCGGLGTGQRAP